jgi:ribose transport system ATP-binding protein
MDEPTSSLQREDVEHLFGLIRQFKNRGITVIYISHFLEEVREIADRFTVLRDGCSVAMGDLASVTDDELIVHMVGRSVESLFPIRAKPSANSETLLEVQALSSPPALKKATLELKRGEIFGIAGLMGSGRTNVVRTIFGLDRIESGLIRVKNQSAGPRSPAQRLAQRVGYLSEDRKNEGLAIKLSIADNVTMTRFASCSRLGWLNLSEQRSRVKRVIDSLAVKARDVEQPVASLSGGNQQKIALARLLHQEADILLLDEPTRGIDIGSKAQVYKTIAECAAAGKAVLMISSYLPELFGMCDRLAVMTRGRLSAARPISEWTPEAVMQAAIAGEGN